MFAVELWGFWQIKPKGEEKVSDYYLTPSYWNNEGFKFTFIYY